MGKLVPTISDNDSAWTLGAGWSKVNLGPGIEPISFYSPEICDDWNVVTVYALAATGGGTFNLSINGEAPVVGSCSGTGTYTFSTTTASTIKASKYNTFTITPTTSLS